MNPKPVARAAMFERMKQDKIFGGIDCGEIVINHFKKMSEDDRAFFKKRLTAGGKSERNPKKIDNFYSDFEQLSESHQLFIVALATVLLDRAKTKFLRQELEKIGCGWALQA